MTLVLSDVLPWGRSFDEYRKMFALSEADLRRRIIGCGDGPASFNAEASERGLNVVSVDPLYVFGADAIARRIAEVTPRIVEAARANAHRFVWSNICSPEHMAEVRHAAMDRFLHDFERGRRAGRYIPAALPRLPFADGAFGLALCSHYLFTYTDGAGDAAHVAAIREMCRVADEVRVFPVVDSEGNVSPHLPGVVAALADADFAVDLLTVDHEFQAGGNQMLRVLRPGA